MKTPLLIILIAIFLPFVTISAKKTKEKVYYNIEITESKCIKEYIYHDTSSSLPLTKRIYTYDNHRKIQNIVIYKWNCNSNTWLNEQKYEYIYNKGKLCRTTVIYWDHKANKWNDKTEKMSYSYDKNGNLSSIKR